MRRIEIMPSLGFLLPSGDIRPVNRNDSTTWAWFYNGEQVDIHDVMRILNEAGITIPRSKINSQFSIDVELER